MKKTKNLGGYAARSAVFLVLFLLLSKTADLLAVRPLLRREQRAFTAYPPGISEKHRTMEYEYLFRTNSWGLRDQEIQTPTPAGVFRILVLGDSYTAGEGVEDEDRFTELLEHEFSHPGKKVEFINGGLTGAGPLEYARLFDRLHSSLSPHAVIICLYANDVQNTSPFSTPAMIGGQPPPPAGPAKALYRLWPNSYALLSGILERGTKWAKSVPEDFVSLVEEEARREGLPEDEIRAWRERLPPELVTAVNHGELNGNGLSYGLLNPWYWVDAIEINSPIAEAKFQAMLRLLEETIRTAWAEGVAAAMIYIPSPFQYDRWVYDPGVKNPWRVSGVKLEERWLGEETPVQIRLAVWAEEQGLPFLDLTPGLRSAAESKGGLTYPLDGHFTRRGHAVSARLIADWLRSSRVFKIE